jgi:ribosomal-protein-alanine N-acetyltransferase
MARLRLTTDRLEVRPLPATAADALPADRAKASHVLGAALSSEWPQPDLLDVLPSQASASPSDERFGVWVMIDRATNSVMGDIGFMGPPDASGSIEVGYSVIPELRRRGYATEAAQAIVDWAVDQPEVNVVVADCDAGNVASIRTLERIGFVRTGETNGQLRWRYEEQRRRGSQG